MSDDLREAVKQRLQAGGWIDVSMASPEDEWDRVTDRAIEAVMGAAELDRLRRWEAIGRALAALAPNANAEDYCWLCDRWHVDVDGHAPGCPWRRAVELLST